MSLPDGLFETILVRAGEPLLLEEHLERLASSARELSLPPPRDPEELRRKILDLPARRGIRVGHLRVTLREGRAEADLLAFPGYPEEVYREGAVARIAEAPGHPLGAWAGHKVLPYAPLLEARERARAGGAFEVLFHDEDGALLEGSVTNLFAVIGGRVVTPPLSRRILPGVTRAATIRAARGAGHEVREEDVFLDDLDRVEEAFLTSSLMEVVPLRLLGDEELRPGPVAASLRRAGRGGAGGAGRRKHLTHIRDPARI